VHKPCMTHIGVAHGLWASLECALLGVVLLFLACVVKDCLENSIERYYS